MGSILAKLVMGVGMKLLTETVFARLVVYSLQEVSKKTDNTLDDKIVKTVADALAVKLD